MKRIILTTTLLSSLASAAFAKEAVYSNANFFDIDVKAEQTTHIGFSNIKDRQSYPALNQFYAGSKAINDQFQLNRKIDNGYRLGFEGEVRVTAKYMTDTGLTFGSHLGMSAERSKERGDAFLNESYVFLGSPVFGDLMFGKSKSAGSALMFDTQTVGLRINDSDSFYFMPLNSARQGQYSAFTTTSTEVSGAGELVRFSYYTPTLNGLSAAISYAHDGKVEDGSRDSLRVRGLDHVLDLGVSYTHFFDANTSIDLGARYGTADRADLNNMSSDAETAGMSAVLEYHDFQFAAAYAMSDENLRASNIRSESVALSAQYTMQDDWTFAAESFYGEQTIAGAGRSLKQDVQTYKVAARRNLTENVNYDFWYVYSETKNNRNIGNSKANVVGTSINITF